MTPETLSRTHKVLRPKQGRELTQTGKGVRREGSGEAMQDQVTNGVGQQGRQCREHHPAALPWW